MNRPIMFLHSKIRANHTYAWHWKPSPRLRKLGWTNRHLGDTPTKNASAEIIAAALELNAQVESTEVAAPRTKERAVFTFGDCVDAYYASIEWTDLKPKTQTEYRARLGQLTKWAIDGTLPLQQLTSGMIRDLKAELMAPGKSRHVAASTLRVLRLLMNWAEAYEYVESSPAARVKITAPEARDVIITPDQVHAAEARALETGLPFIANAIILGFWTLQRKADLLALTRTSWRVIEDVAPADAAVLSGWKGDVMGFRLKQQKTGAWVDCPVPPMLHERIEAGFKSSQFLVADDTQPEQAYNPYTFYRRQRKIFDAVGLEGGRFQDLRRSGMSSMRDLGVADATPISGHAILGRKSILDTYMPANTRAACAAMATALRTLERRKQNQIAQ